MLLDMQNSDIEYALAHDFELGQLSVHYQPQADLQTGRICGMESLLRWQHPEFGNIPPSLFIPLAEQSLQIIQIGEWVIRRACQDLRQWLDMGIKVPPVAVNISPLQFSDQLLSTVRGAMDQYQIAPDMLELEVTEGSLMSDVAASERMLNAFKLMGLKLSLDDFGTGYSSLSYLKRYPFDRVKIDQSFVRDLATSSSDQMLVGVIVSMAHGLGMKVIAEGVETEAQCEILRESVCDEIQGYFYSRPIPALRTQEFLVAEPQLPAHLLRMRKPVHSLLLVDDEPNVIYALRRLLRPLGLNILEASGPLAALELLQSKAVDIVISDQRMPDMSGVEFLSIVKERVPDTTRILLTGHADLATVIDAVNKGSVYRFLTKPWEDQDLIDTLRSVIALKDMQAENRQLQMKLHMQNHERVAAIRLQNAGQESTNHTGAPT